MKASEERYLLGQNTTCEYLGNPLYQVREITRAVCWQVLVSDDGKEITRAVCWQVLVSDDGIEITRAVC